MHFSLGSARTVLCGLGKIRYFWGSILYIESLRQEHMMLLGNWGKDSLPQVLPNNYSGGLS